MRKTKNKANQSREKNPFEEFIDSLSGNIASQTKESVEERLAGRSGELYPGQELIFKEFQKNKAEVQEKNSKITLGIDYSREIIQIGEKAVSRENREIEAQLREIITEIKKLTDSSKELQIQFKEVAVEQYVATPGKYHKSFFSWLLSIIRAARQKVEDSGAWLKALQSKKKSRSYAAMAKKQGTSFTLNNERTVATQVG
jgi:hypothetical protein